MLEFIQLIKVYYPDNKSEENFAILQNSQESPLKIQLKYEKC